MLPLDSVVYAYVIGFRMRTGAAVVDAVLARHIDEVREIVMKILAWYAIDGKSHIFLNSHDNFFPNLTTKYVFPGNAPHSSLPSSMTISLIANVIDGLFLA